MSELLKKDPTEEIGKNHEKTLLDPPKNHTLELDNQQIYENKNKHLDSTEDLAETDSISNITNNNKNSKQLPKSHSLKNSPTRDINPALLVPTENLNNLFTKLQSAGKFRMSIIDNLDLTGNKEELKIISNNKICKENKNVEDHSKHTNNLENSSNNNPHNTLKNTKNLFFSNIKSVNLKAPRETTILDEKFNVQEILNEKNNLLITESNENFSDSSREENNENFAHKNFSHRKVESMNINMTEYNLKRFEEAACLNQLANYQTYDNFILSDKKDPGSLLNDKFFNINDLSKKVSILWKSQIKNIPTNSQNFNYNNKKNQINNKSRHSKMTKSTDMSSAKGGFYSDSMVASNTSTKFTQKQKTKLGSSNPPNKPPLVKSIDKKLPSANINKNFNTAVKTINSTSKTPPKTKTNTPVISNRTSKVMHKDSLNKSLITSNKKTQFSANGVNKNSLANSHNDPKSKMSLSNKKNDTYNSQNKSFRDTPFTIISEECEYSKILVELKCIFGENLENFDEQLLFSNLDEISNKGLIKGLIMLSHLQDKNIMSLEQNIAAERAEFNSKLKEKDQQIKKIDEEMKAIKSSLRGLMGEVTPVSKQFPKSSQKSKITEPLLSTKNTFSNK